MKKLKETFIKLKDKTNIKPFDCGSEDYQIDLTNFLFDNAKLYQKEKMGTTYILENSKHTIAFCTILNDKISMSLDERTIWNKINRNISNNKRRKSYPAIKIGSLATNTIYQKQGYGAALIDFIKEYLLSNKQFSGCRFITVDASNNEKTISFYKNYGFKFLSEKDEYLKTRCMYHDIMKTE